MKVYDCNNPEFFESVESIKPINLGPDRQERLDAVWPIVLQAVLDTSRSLTVATPTIDATQKDYGFGALKPEANRTVNTAQGVAVTYDQHPSTFCKFTSGSSIESVEQLRNLFLDNAVRGVLDYIEETIKDKGATLIAIRPLPEPTGEFVRSICHIVNGLFIRVLFSVQDDGSLLFSVDSSYGLA